MGIKRKIIIKCNIANQILNNSSKNIINIFLSKHSEIPNKSGNKVSIFSLWTCAI